MDSRSPLKNAREPAVPHSYPPAQQESLDVTRLVAHLLTERQDDIYRKISLAVDRAVIQAVLGYTRGNQQQACELLGISRTTLRAKLRRLGVAIEKTLSPASDEM